MTMNPNNNDIFTRYESNVRSYCRKLKGVFLRASGSYIYDREGTAYLDFLCCASALNYGHNHATLKQAISKYLLEDGIQGALDLHTEAKEKFIDSFIDKILHPRDLDYKLQFTSPTGTTVVESAVKLARKITQRSSVVAFTNSYHGMTSTALGLTGNQDNRQMVVDNNVYRIPYDGYFPELNSLELFQKLLDDRSSGYDLPAAVIVETVQGEGGINVASTHWLQQLRALTTDKGILLIIDDIQAGCGRTGGFFSFETSGIQPDLICLSKSLSGYGYPLSLLLISRNLDCWFPGEDNGTFRGNSLALVAATAAVEHFWSDNKLSNKVEEDSVYIMRALNQLLKDYPSIVKEVRGRGMMIGLEFFDSSLAKTVAIECFENQLIIECCGNEGQVLKLLPPLTIERADLNKGLTILSKVLSHLDYS